MGRSEAPVRARVEPTCDAGPVGEPYATATETHTSVLLLVGDRAYKVKKPIALPFVDLSTRAARLADCRREVELNRRLTPDVYLGVQVLRPDSVITGTSDEADDGEPVVVMRRMPWSRRLSRLVRDAGAAPADERLRTQVREAVADVARQVATLHADLPAVRDLHLLPTMIALWQEGHAQLAAFHDVLPAADCDEVLSLAEEYLAGRAGLLERREQAGLVVEGHGDLLADDIYCLDDGPRILDCLEFDRRLRLGDVLMDLAFLAMDLESLGAPDLARLLVDTYRQLSDEHHPRSLEHHYVAYRAFVRAKVDCLRHAQGEPGAAERARTHLELCRRALRRGQVHLVLIGGLPGTGKSTLAQAVADADPDRDWAVLCSDEVRKDGAGLAHDSSAAAPFRTGLYDPAWTDLTYTELLHRAGLALAGGVDVVLDASWTDAELRRRARAVALRQHAALVELRCVADADLCRRRLAARGPRHVSDAGPAVHQAMSAIDEPWPEAVDVPTDGPVETALDVVLTRLDPELHHTAPSPTRGGSPWRRPS